MSGNPQNATIWGDANVYTAPLDAPNPATIDDPFGPQWDLVGLLDGEAGFEEARSRDSNDFFAWGQILVRTSRRNFVLTRKFVALEDNAVVAGLVWPGSSATKRVVPKANHRFKIAFETFDGDKKKRVISTLYVEVEEVATISEKESELTKFEITVKIYPTGEGELFDVQGTDEALTLVSISTTPANKAIAVGEYAPLTATANYSDGSTLDVSDLASWVSAVPARVATDGKFVRGVSAGAAVNVTATYRDRTATTSVTPSAP